MAVLRLDKLLAHQRHGSRREVTNWIRAGAVLVNGIAVRDAAIKVNTREDVVICQGATVRYEQNRYYMLNKPMGVISATRDDMHQTVLSLFPKRDLKGLFPVGRLDIDTTGLLLVTDDGAFSHRITAPANHVEKEYHACVWGKLKKDACERFAAGLVTKHGDAFAPADLTILHYDEAQNTSEIFVVLREGQYHQVKRMVKAVGGEVQTLKRVRIGALQLDEALGLGEYRNLTNLEIEYFDKK